MKQTTDQTPGSGISHELAAARRASIRRLAYALDLTIPAEASAPVRGHVSIQILLAPASDWPAIDFAPYPESGAPNVSIGRLTVDGRDSAFESLDGHIVLTSEPEPSGLHTIDIEFQSCQQALTRRDDLAYTLFVPARAHRLFPCFDQPDLKATLSLQLRIPREWEVIANASEMKRTDAGRDQHVRFAQTEPLPTYLYAFAAGRFLTTDATVNGYRMRMLHLSRDVDLVNRNCSEIFRLHAAALEFLETYTGIRQPFPEFAFVLLPDFEFAGMEHPGCIFYREDFLLLGSDATQTTLQRRANLIAHETAHLWFGDLVTMKWFGDVWLKEVFANFMADKILERLFPETDHALAFVLRHYPPAYSIDRTKGALAIRRGLANLNDAAELYDALIYHKAPIAMASLERMLGPDNMQTALRSYLTDFAFANADWPELRARIEKAATTNLVDWSRRWIEATGKPHVGSRNSDQRLPEYGQHDLDTESRKRRLATLANSADSLERAGAWLVLYEDMLDGGMKPKELVPAAAAALESETSDLFVSRLLDDLEEIYWRFLTEPRRREAAVPVERALKLRLDAADDAPSASLWIEALSRFALLPGSIGVLETIWRDGHPLPGVMTETLAVKLAIRLAQLRPTTAASILARQANVTKDARRRRRLDLAGRALAAKRAERVALFDNLAAGNESGVMAVATLRLLCDPLGEGPTVHYLKPGIERAAESAEQGDIFLPRQWLQALFWGHGSGEAATAIGEAIQVGTYRPAFVSVVLQMADPVFRAAAIRA